MSKFRMARSIWIREIEALLDFYKLTLKDLSRTMGISEFRLKRWLYRKNGLKLKHFVQIATALGVRFAPQAVRIDRTNTEMEFAEWPHGSSKHQNLKDTKENKNE